jgi:hypothetical protein
MTLILHWADDVHFQELHLSIPLPFLDFYKALDDLQRRYPDADIVVDRIELSEAACVYRPKSE